MASRKSYSTTWAERLLKWTATKFTSTEVVSDISQLAAISGWVLRPDTFVAKAPVRKSVFASSETLDIASSDYSDIRAAIAEVMDLPSLQA